MKLPALFAGDRRGTFAMLVGNGFHQGLMAVVSAVLVMRIFDALGGKGSGLLGLLAALGGVILCSAMLRRRERIDAELLGQRYAKSLRQRLYARLLSTDARAFRKRRKGALLLKFVGDLSAIRRWISLGLARLLVAGVVVILTLTALTWLYWPFAAGLAGVFGLSTAWIVWQGAALRAAIAESRRRQSTLSANVTEKLSTLATVQAFGQARRERRLMRLHSARLVDASVNKAAHIGSLRAVIDATAGAAVLVVFTVAYLFPPQDLTPGMIAAVVSIIGFLTPPLRDLGRAQEYWLAAAVARRNLQALAKRAPRLRNRRGGLPLRIKSGAVVFDAVSVTGALEQVSAEAPAGARIAVLGPNGSGKSTLLGLVGRLYDPDQGRVLIEGQDVSAVRLSSLRRRVAYVSADLPLISGSLRKNLCYGAGKVKRARLARVIAECELGDLIDRKAGGLKARIAEAGSDLSQGERVRVSLARALLRRPAILILDEAEAHLDARAIRALHGVIERFTGTVLMATHRSAALRLCTAAWTLDHGRLNVEGPPASTADDGTEALAPDVSAGWHQPLVAGQRLGRVQ